MPVLCLLLQQRLQLQKQLQHAVEGENGAALQVTELPLPAVMLAQPDLQLHIGGGRRSGGLFRHGTVGGGVHPLLQQDDEPGQTGELRPAAQSGAVHIAAKAVLPVLERQAKGPQTRRNASVFLHGAIHPF